MSDVPEWVVRLYESHMEMARHHDEQRSHVGNILFTIDAALIALMGVLASTKGFVGFPLLGVAAPLAALVLTGSFGAVFSAKQFERSKYHLSQATGLEEHIYELGRDAQLRSTYERVIQEHKRAWPRTNQIHLYQLWVGLHWTVAAAALGALGLWLVLGI